MKIYCEECNGRGYWGQNQIRCEDCSGQGYTQLSSTKPPKMKPPKQPDFVPTARDYFAAAALTGALACSGSEDRLEDIMPWVWKYADAMIEERGKP